MKKIILFPILLLFMACSNIFNQQPLIPVKASDHFITLSPNEFRARSFLLTKESLKNIYYTDRYTTQNIVCEAQGNLNLFGSLDVDHEVQTTLGYVIPISLRICPKDDAYNDCKVKVSSEELSALKKDFKCHFEFSGLLRFDKKISQSFGIGKNAILNAPVKHNFGDFDKMIQEEAKKAILKSTS
ncbi:hypothetical protein [uncultured Acinetobacter sp.]|uniref:hypothetical protein n=1 Tax=uncultured Acinetobacter sp. TaxID=165433 RepID=UPI0025858EE1|nr:hypothetical protein [uncultured Acinetobacter sp.]